MLIGLFGGSFDPVHFGHLKLAEACLAQAKVDEVWFTPAAVQPHKPTGPRASNSQRVEMLHRALSGRTGLVTSLVEIERGGVSYTADTLRQLTRAYPDAQWRVVMGADTLHDLPTWREPREVLRRAFPLVTQRPGEPKPDFSVLAPLLEGKKLDALVESVVDMPPTDISSSEIRRRVAAGESIAGLTPDSVAEYIAAEGLYR